MDQQNRPKTRGLEASEAEEDARTVKAALQEPAKFVKKAHQKLKNDYGRGKGNDDEEDEEDKIFYEQPPYDDDETEVKPGARRKRGGGRRSNVRKRARGDGEEEMMRRPTMSARLTAILKEDAKPKIVPYNKSTIEHKSIPYRLGDIVATEKDDSTYYAQILGFHTDQFCERYATIRWLLPRWDLDDPCHPPITPEVFKAAIEGDDPINMNCFRFVLRPSAQYVQSESPHTITRNRCYRYNSKLYYFDSPTNTLTSAERRY